MTCGNPVDAGADFQRIGRGSAVEKLLNGCGRAADNPGSGVDALRKSARRGVDGLCTPAGSPVDPLSMIC